MIAWLGLILDLRVSSAKAPAVSKPTSWVTTSAIDDQEREQVAAGALHSARLAEHGQRLVLWKSSPIGGAEQHDQSRARRRCC